MKDMMVKQMQIDIMQNISEKFGLSTDAQGMILSLPIDKVVY